MKISIALCTYNGEKYLKEQLDSILNQSRKPDEVIICDDQSSDGTWSILDQFKKEAPFEVRLIQNESNLGSTANFANAISLCTGEIIFLSDQDDVWLPQKLTIIANIFEKDQGVGLIFSNALVTDDCLHPYSKSLWDCVQFGGNIQRLCLQGRLWSVLGKTSYVTGATMAFRSKWRFIFEPIPTNWVHDAWIVFVVDLVSRVNFVPEKLIKYRIHQNQQLGVGVCDRSAFVRWRLSIFPDKNRRRYQQNIERMESLLKQIRDFRNYLREPAMYDELVAQLEHWRTRYNLPRNPLKRWRVIRKEIDTGRYRKYSESNRMAFKDFFD